MPGRPRFGSMEGVKVALGNKGFDGRCEGGLG